VACAQTFSRIPPVTLEIPPPYLRIHYRIDATIAALAQPWQLRSTADSVDGDQAASNLFFALPILTRHWSDIRHLLGHEAPNVSQEESQDQAHAAESDAPVHNLSACSFIVYVQLFGGQGVSCTVRKKKDGTGTTHTSNKGTYSLAQMPPAPLQ
jgi:hypothetical protein